MVDRDGSDTPRRGLFDGMRPLVTVVGATVTVWAVAAVAMLIYTFGARDPVDHTLIIPEGTAAKIATGANPLLIPDTWVFQADDRLVLVNQDQVGHQVGPYYVAGGSTQAHVLQPALAEGLLCSLHPDGVITLDVDVRDFDWALTMIPTLAFGPAVGLVALAVRRTLRQLDEEPESEELGAG